MGQPRVLTFNFHEPYLCLLARTGLRIDVGIYGHGDLARPWHHAYRDPPPNLRLLAEADWRGGLRRGEYDVLIAQNEMNALDVLRAPAQKLMVQHNRRRFLETRLETPRGDPKAAYAAMLETLRQAYEFVFISESKRADAGCPGRVILPGIDVAEHGGHTGREAAVLRVGNTMTERDLMFDVALQERVCAGLPNRVAGHNPDLPGAAPAPSHAALLDLYRSHRCLLHVTREEYEDGYNLAMLEAMAVGMPVVALANATSPLTDGVDGYTAPDAEGLRARVEALLADPALAREIGARGRDTVARRFPIAAFADAWRAAIFEAAETTPHSAGDPRAMRLVVQHAASPTTTAGYLARALARVAAVRTAGFRVPEALYTRWGYPEPPPPYPPLQIPLRHDEPYAALRDALAEAPAPEALLYIDSGLARLPDDLAAVPWPKAAYLIDTHIAPETRLAMALHFDLVFLAQRAQAGAFRRAGVARVEWLPLACDPALHGVPAADRDLDVAYVGALDPGEPARRRRLLDTVRARFPNSRIGKAWPTDMARIYARAKIVVNLCVARDVNMRVFEALASGALLITDDADGLEELFTDGEHLVICRDDAAMPDTIQRWLDDPAGRARVAAAGRAKVLAEHTYAHRAAHIARRLREVFPPMPQAEDERPADKPKSYYENPREEVLRQIPAFARRVLDVGCGAGVLGRAIKAQRPGAYVAGLEVVEAVAREARQILDTVVVGNLETLELPFENGFFDCIVCADVLEHLAEPEAALRKLSRVLAPDGVVVISIPNVQFVDVVAMLAEGQWTYMDAGITDATHLRFFTRAGVERLVREAGLDPLVVGPLSMLRENLLPRTATGGIRTQALEIAQVSDQEYEDFRTYQFLAVAGHPGADRLSRARVALEHRHDEAALALAAEALGVDPAERARIAGKALVRLGRLDEAEAQLRAALAAAPASHAAAEDLGILLVGLGRHDEAEPLLRRAMEGPRGGRARGALGLLLEARGDYAGAYEALRDALSEDFDHHALAPHFAACAEATGQTGDAEPILRAFADFYPGNMDLLRAHAAALLLIGRRAEARERLELPRMIAPDDPRIAALWAATEDADAPGA